MVPLIYKDRKKTCALERSSESICCGGLWNLFTEDAYSDNRGFLEEIDLQPQQHGSASSGRGPGGSLTHFEGVESVTTPINEKSPPEVIWGPYRSSWEDRY